jgi:hypothetical protein
MVRCVAITESKRRCKKSACYSDFCGIHCTLTCSICKTDRGILERQVLTDCGHIFCKECIAGNFLQTQWFDGFSTEFVINCPECDLPVSDKDWTSITSFLCDHNCLRRKIVYDTYLYPQLLKELAPLVKLGAEYDTQSYFFIFNEWNRISNRQKYLPAIDTSEPDIVTFHIYTTPSSVDQLVFRFFYGDKITRSLFEVFQKELVEYVFHPKRIQRFGGIEYLDEI